MQIETLWCCVRLVGYEMLITHVLPVVIGLRVLKFIARILNYLGRNPIPKN